jgi:hypothetical protein
MFRGMKTSLMCVFHPLCLALALATAGLAQQPAKPKRPVKNPPQFPNIIDLEGKAPPPVAQPQPAAPAPETPPQAAAPPDLAAAMVALAGELRTLSREIKALNLRSQAQLDLMKITRLDLRVDHYERELRPIRERLAALDADENTLQQMMTRDSLMAQTAQAPTFNRDELMRQLRAQHDLRLRAVQAEKERLRKLETDVAQSLSIYQKLASSAEQRVQEAEELLKQIENDLNPKAGKKP